LEDYLQNQGHPIDDGGKVGKHRSSLRRTSLFVPELAERNVELR
jgi:hypothetical protein